MKVKYYVIPFTVQHLCESGTGFDNYKEAVKLAKLEAKEYGKAIIDKMVWKDSKLIKKETLVLKSDGSFYVI